MEPKIKDKDKKSPQINKTKEKHPNQKKMIISREETEEELSLKWTNIKK